VLSQVFCPQEPCLLYSGDLRGNLVAAGTVFRTVLVWNAESGDILKKLAGHQGVIFDVTWLGDSCLTSVSDDRSVRVWSSEGSAEHLEQTAEMYGHTARIWKVMPLQNFKERSLLVTVCENATCRVWDASTGKQIHCLSGHLGKNVRTLAIE